MRIHIPILCLLRTDFIRYEAKDPPELGGMLWGGPCRMVLGQLVDLPGA